MITYRSGPEWDTRFGHKRQYPEDSPSFCPDFAIEWYLDKKVGLLRNDFVSLCKMCVCVCVCVCALSHQGGTFGDPNSFLYISKVCKLPAGTVSSLCDSL